MRNYPLKQTIKLSDKDLKSKKSASPEKAYTLPSAPDYSSMSEKKASEVQRGGDFSFIPSYAGGETGAQYDRFGEQDDAPLYKRMTCWKGYVAKGKKKSPSGKKTKSGKIKMVNNCVKK